MSEWKEYALTEMGTLQRGRSRHRPRYAFHLYGGPYPFIQTGEIRAASKYITSYDQTYSEAGLAQSKLWPAGTLCITIAANIAEVAILTFDACFPDSVLGFIPNKEKSDLDFVFYLLTYYQKDLQQHGEGSVQDNINLGTFENIKFRFPDVNEQRIIGEMLSTLDNKIQLLNQQNETLEKLGETLFRQWFTEEATTKEEITLDEFVSSVNGYSYSSSELNPSENALVTLKSFNRNGSFRLDGFKEFTGPVKPHQTVKQGDLIVSHTDITQEAEVIGNPALVIEDPRYKQLVITMDMVKVVPKDDRLSIPFLYFLMRTPEFKFHCLGCSNGTTVLHMSKSAIPTFSFPKPDYEKVKTFTENAGNLLEKTFKNHAQVRSLNNFRDTILPKLMSGEATIKE